MNSSRIHGMSFDFHDRQERMPGCVLFTDVVVGDDGKRPPFDESRAGSLAVVYGNEAPDNYLPHLFHFLEHVIANVYALDLYGLSADDVDRFLFPTVPDERWKGRAHEHNRHLLNALYPRATEIRHGGDPALADGSIMTRRLLFLDRAPMDDLGINKMCAALFSRLAPATLSAAIDRLHAWCGVERDTRPDRPLVVTYVARKNLARSFPARLERRIDAALSAIQGIDYRRVYMEDLDFRGQVRAAAASDVLLGIHGNGLSHGLFLRPHRVLVEVFPRGVFHLDYYSMAMLRRHGYHALRGGKALPPTEYFPHGRPRGRVRGLPLAELVRIVELAKIFVCRSE